MVNVNNYKGFADIDIIEAAIKDRGTDGVVVLPARKSDVEPERDWWLIDRAILLPSNTTFIMQNSKIKLSDKCRDNFFRTANCYIGCKEYELDKVFNIHIKGEGYCVLEGADHPRATGDSSKQIKNPCPFKWEDIVKFSTWIPEERRSLDKLGFWDLHDYSYGTDCGKEGESQYGDWRGIGVLFVNGEHCSVSGIKIVCSHGWAISFEAMAYCRIEKVEIDANMTRVIEGFVHNSENQDGIDLRNGCHDIVVTDITGGSGDDLIALTAIARDDLPLRPNGAMRSTHFMHSDWSKRDRNIYNITIRNVTGCCASGVCFIIRLLPAGCKIYNIVIDGVIDNSPDALQDNGVLLLGDGGGYGRENKDDMTFITISNVICKAKRAICLEGYLSNSAITNVINRNPDCPVIDVRYKGGLNNVLMSNLVSTGEATIRYNGVAGQSIGEAGHH